MLERRRNDPVKNKKTPPSLPEPPGKAMKALKEAMREDFLDGNKLPGSKLKEDEKVVNEALHYDDRRAKECYRSPLERIWGS